MRRTALQRTATMEFVLFLCAALSALTGAITGTRAPGIEVQIERVSARAGLVDPVAAIVRAPRLPALRTVLGRGAARPFALSAAIPLVGERRRE